MLKDKVALVTGGSRGIGKAIALKLAEQGADIVVNYFRHNQAAEQTAAEIKALGVKAEVIKANVGDPEKIAEMFDTIRERFGRLDMLISNAASGLPSSALELDDKKWDWTMDINAKAFLFCAQQAAKLMEGRGGKMVTISSMGSHRAIPGYVAIGISKATLEALTRYLAVELAPKDICVNGVTAAYVTTESGMIYAKAAQEQMGGTPTWQTTPAGRAVAPEDVANVVAFLCSDEASMIRGQLINIDGGFSLTP